MDLPHPGQRIRVELLPDIFQVYEASITGDQVLLGVISTASGQAQTMVLSIEEVGQRVKRLATLAEAFRSRQWLPGDPFLLFVEVLRMRLAYAFDPHYAVSVTQVDMLPHQRWL